MIHIDDLEVGQYITVVDRDPVEVQEYRRGVVQTRLHKDRSWFGDALEIQAVQLPYIVVDMIGPGGLTGIKLDTRKLVLDELDNEYVEAMEND